MSFPSGRCPYCGCTQRIPFDFDWFCMGCSETYPTQAWCCKHPGCLEDTGEDYCADHQPPPKDWEEFEDRLVGALRLLRSSLYLVLRIKGSAGHLDSWKHADDIRLELGAGSPAAATGFTYRERVQLAKGAPRRPPPLDGASGAERWLREPPPGHAPLDLPRRDQDGAVGKERKKAGTPTEIHGGSRPVSTGAPKRI